MSRTYAFAMVMVIAGITALLRFLPFLIFRKGTPEPVRYLGGVLPYAIMGMLVVYCLKNISFTSAGHGLPELLSVLFVALLHKWKHNTLLSILAGTIFYMLLVQLMF